MGRNGLAQLLRYTILDSFVSKSECESCRPKTEALEEAFGMVLGLAIGGTC